MMGDGWVGRLGYGRRRVREDVVERWVREGVRELRRWMWIDGGRGG